MKTLKILILASSLMVLACEKETPQPECSIQITEEQRIFEFLHRSSGETFLAWTSDAAVIQQVEMQLVLSENQRNQHINGKILRLPPNCSLNQKWSWYFAPDDWSLAELSVEVCDGEPQYVEENLNEFADNVGRFCPWSSIVLREVVN